MKTKYAVSYVKCLFLMVSLKEFIFVSAGLEYVPVFLSRELSKGNNIQLMAVRSSKFAINRAINAQMGSRTVAALLFNVIYTVHILLIKTATNKYT